MLRDGDGMNKITNAEVMFAAGMLWEKVRDLSKTPLAVWGIPRGGVSAAYALAAASHGGAFITTVPSLAGLIVDDLFDSGATMRAYAEEFPDTVRGVLFTKNDGAAAAMGCYYGKAKAAHEWLVFPWEDSVQGSADDIVTRLLQFIGEDPQRPGLVETPARVIKAWQEWCAGYGQDPAAVLKTFADGAERVDEMVVVRDIPIYSHCEHHLAPFFGVAHISYIPNGRIVGLSKLVRLADIFARRLQVQERLTNQIADALVEHLAPKGVGVIIECRHLCMESRGVRKAGATTITSAMRGALLTKPEARAELMSLVRR